MLVVGKKSKNPQTVHKIVYLILNSRRNKLIKEEKDKNTIMEHMQQLPSTALTNNITDNKIR